MRKQQHYLEIFLIATCIAVLAALLWGNSQPSEVDDDPDLQAMSVPFKEGRFQECLDASLKRRQHDPSDLVAIRYQGMAMAKLNNPQGALNVFSHGIDLVGPPTFLLNFYANRLGRLRLERARVYLQTGQAQKALDDLQLGLGRQGDGLLNSSGVEGAWEYYNLEAMAQVSLGNSSEAQEDLRSAAADDPSEAIVKKHQALLETGKDEQMDEPACESWCPICHGATRANR